MESTSAFDTWGRVRDMLERTWDDANVNLVLASDEAACAAALMAIVAFALNNRIIRFSVGALFGTAICACAFNETCNAFHPNTSAVRDMVSWADNATAPTASVFGISLTFVTVLASVYAALPVYWSRRIFLFGAAYYSVTGASTCLSDALLVWIQARVVDLLRDPPADLAPRLSRVLEALVVVCVYAMAYSQLFTAS